MKKLVNTMPKTYPGFFPHSCPVGSSIQRQHGRLPLIESILYFVGGIASIGYVIYQVYLTSQKYQWLMHEDDFVDGWKFVNHKKDISNYEWRYWSSYFFVIFPWILGHVVISRIVDNVFIEFRKTIFLVYSLLSVTYLIGYRCIILFTLHGVICYIVSSFGSFSLVWMASLLLVSTLNSSHFTSIMKDACGLSDEGYYLLIFTLAFISLRYTSFCLERSRFVSRNNKVEKRPVSSANEIVETEGFGVSDLLLYMFYLPLFFTGPLITYDKFRIQINSAPSLWTLNRILSSIKSFVRVIFWALVIELSHHFLYYSALAKNIGTIREMSLWALAGLGYLQGQLFMLKYLVMYDLPGQVARLDDMEPPLGPKCISYIYRYSDMWKYFDRGLYTFLRNYIYIPMGGSQVGLFSRLLASGACFLYIFIWHGQEYYLLIWCIINYAGCALELLAGQLESTSFISRIKSALSPAMVRRIRCLLVVPLFLTSCFAIFYFFNGVTVGEMFLKRLVTNASTKSLLVLYFLIYANLQNAMEVERWLAAGLKSR